MRLTSVSIIIRLTSLAVVITLLCSLGANLAAAEGAEMPAQGVITVDLQSGAILGEQDADEAVQTPGLNRLLTVYAALLMWPDAADSTIVVSGADLQGISSDGPTIEAGTSASFDEIIRAALIAGRAEAARALARVAGSASGFVDAEALIGFVQRSNDLFTQLGLTQTHLDLDGTATTTTAAELAQITTLVLNHVPSLASVFSSADAAVDGRMVPSLLTTDGQQLAGVAAPEGQSMVLISTQGQRSVIAVLLGVQTEEWLLVASGVLGQSLATAASSTSANAPKLPALETDGTRDVASSSVSDTQPGASTSEFSARKLMLRWPLAILSIVMLAAVIIVQRPEARRLRSKAARRRAKREPASTSAPAPNVANYTSWETDPLASSSGD